MRSRPRGNRRLRRRPRKWRSTNPRCNPAALELDPMIVMFPSAKSRYPQTFVYFIDVLRHLLFRLMKILRSPAPWPGLLSISLLADILHADVHHPRTASGLASGR